MARKLKHMNIQKAGEASVCLKVKGPVMYRLFNNSLPFSGVCVHYERKVIMKRALL